MSALLKLVGFIRFIWLWMDRFCDSWLRTPFAIIRAVVRVARCVFVAQKRLGKGHLSGSPLHPLPFHAPAFFSLLVCPEVILLMARPRKLANARQTHWLTARVTADEKARVVARAAKAGLGESDYVRAMAIDGKIVIRQSSDLSGAVALAAELR